MKRPCLRVLAAVSAPALASLLVTAVALPAAAQGTMTPNQPPAAGAATGTPNQPPPAPPAEPPPVLAAPPSTDLSTDAPEPKTHQAPPAHTGFQIAARVGAAIPLGNAADGAPLSDGLGAQFATVVDIGGKVIPQLFLGAYLGANVGGVGAETSKSCDQQRATGCLGFTYRIGVEAQYHILPDGKVDPWVGYGIGYEVSRVLGNASGTTVSTTLVGPEYGHFMAGVDFRLTKVFGIGPFVDLAVAKYTNQSSEPDASRNGEISNKATHQWLTIGAKFLFFP